jgi:chromosome segregation ATPase
MSACFNRFVSEIIIVQKKVLIILLNSSIVECSDTLINDLTCQIQAQQAALQGIETRISEQLKDITTYSNDLKAIDSGVPAIEESVDLAWRVMGTKTKLEQCHQQCILLVRRLRTVNTAMNRREQKLSRYRNWLRTMQVRVDVMTLSGRNSYMWQQRWKYLSSKLIASLT